MKALMTFFAGITSVIAAGVLVIAYSLVSGRAVTSDAVLSRPMYASDRATLVDDAGRYAVPVGMTGYPADYRAVPASDVRAIPAVETYTPRPATVARPVSAAPRQVRVARSSGRDWKKMAMIIGGSSAAGAGLGAIIGGKKGALIGAAIGGGASTIYETTKR
jgi:hypothetical protein